VQLVILLHKVEAKKRRGTKDVHCTMGLPCFAEKDREAATWSAARSMCDIDHCFCYQRSVPECTAHQARFSYTWPASHLHRGRATHHGLLAYGTHASRWCSRHAFPACAVPWLKTCTRGICAVGIGSTARGRLECEGLHEGGASSLSRVRVCEVYIVTCTGSFLRPCYPSLISFLRWQTRDSITCRQVARYAQVYRL
jgi:hypothetical protein